MKNKIKATFDQPAVFAIDNCGKELNLASRVKAESRRDSKAVVKQFTFN
jgi:hypothetical protein